MQRPFRSCVVLILMSLLLVRSWAGDAMAIGMMQMRHTPASVAMAMADGHHAGTETAMPCNEMASSQASDTTPMHDMSHDASHEAMHNTTDGNSHTADSCGTCTVCQVCHSTAMAALASPLPAFDQPQTVPRAALNFFSSAEPQQGFKPPIS